MRFIAVTLFVLFLYFQSTTQAFAQSPIPTPSNSPDIAQTSSGSNVLTNFISGFDWISSGLIFYTPSLLDSSIKLQDGTELTGMSSFRTIFYNIAVPLFVLITSAVAFTHISNDNSMQLKQFFKRLVLIVALFIVTPAILSYSIQFTNLLNAKIIAGNTFNISTFINSFLDSFMQIPMFRGLFGGALIIPSWNTVLQLIIFIISIGFLLIGFIYIVFQAVIRFIALLVLSVIFPVVLPFALSEKTENITNTYFKTWFSFLIQQPAFVLGFAIVSAILSSIVQAHNNNIGTLFVYSGALLFLGGINVFIGKIFGDGWSLLSTNAQSMIIARAVNRNLKSSTKMAKIDRIPSYAGAAAKNSFTQVKNKLSGGFINDNKTSDDGGQKTNQNIKTIRKYIKDMSEHPHTSSKHQVTTIDKQNKVTSNTNAYTGSKMNSSENTDKRNIPNTSINSAKEIRVSEPKKVDIATRKIITIKPIRMKPADNTNSGPKDLKTLPVIKRKKVTI